MGQLWRQLWAQGAAGAGGGGGGGDAGAGEVEAVTFVLRSVPRCGHAR